MSRKANPASPVTSPQGEATRGDDRMGTDWLPERLPPSLWRTAARTGDA
jgi:hypothetical protein